MLIYSFITDYQAFSLRYKDNTTRDKNETKVGKQSANLGKNNEPIQNRLSFLIDCKSVTLHHLTILSFPMVRPAWDNWWLLIDALSYEESEFRQTEWEFLNKGSINIKSYSHYTELKAKDKEGSFGVSLDKIAMTEKFDRTLDMFFLLPFDFNIYVSETLKDKMESCGIKGISFPSSVIF